MGPSLFSHFLPSFHGFHMIPFSWYKYGPTYHSSSTIQQNHYYTTKSSSPLPSHFSFHAMELEKTWVTELQVRMDCNGCVHKIKKALHGVEGVHDVHIDYPQQRITVVGKANPERMVKAIKKTRKLATICSHRETIEPTNSDKPPSDPPADGAPSEPPEAPKKEEEPSQPPPPEAPAPTEDNTPPQPQPPQPSIQARDVEEIPMMHHYPHHGFVQHEVPYSYYVTPTHSYNNYTPPSSTTIFYSGNNFSRSPSPPRNNYYHYSNGVQEHYNSDYDYQQHHHAREGGYGNNNIGSMFSDENPNACTIS